MNEAAVQTVHWFAKVGDVRFAEFIAVIIAMVVICVALIYFRHKNGENKSPHTDSLTTQDAELRKQFAVWQANNLESQKQNHADHLELGGRIEGLRKEVGELRNDVRAIFRKLDK